MAWLLRCVLLAVLVLGWEPVLAQSAPSESVQFQARIEEAAKALASYPPLKNVSGQKRQQLTEFVVANTLFAFVHEIGHAVIHENGATCPGKGRRRCRRIHNPQYA